MGYRDHSTLLRHALEGAGDPDGYFVLFRDHPRPLLIATEALPSASRIVEFFVRHPLNHAWASFQLFWQRHGRGMLPVEQLALPPVTALTGGMDGKVLAIQYGSPGPLQKAVVLIESLSFGRPRLAVAKVAMGGDADQAVRIESRWLARLAAYPMLHGLIPDVLADGVIGASGRAFLCTSASEGRCDAGAKAMDERHRDFLAKLVALSRQDGAWPNSNAERRTRQRLQSLAGIAKPERLLLGECLDEAARRIGDAQVPFVLSHGDFTPWNIRLLDVGAYVYDWEYAEWSANPLADLLHFHWMPHATRGRRPPRKALAATRRAALAHLQGVFGLGHADALVDGLMLHYLADTVLFYAEKSGRMITAHAVVSAYLGLLRRRDAWVARHG